MPFRETLLNLAITAVLVLIITLVAILLKESRPVPVAAIPVGKAAPSAAAESGLPAAKAEFEVFPKAKLIESKNNEADTLRIKVKDSHEETVFTLYFADAPESSLTHPQLVQDQSRYFQISGQLRQADHVLQAQALVRREGLNTRLVWRDLLALPPEDLAVLR